VNRPWLKFFPSDWLGDEALARSSLAAQGLWIRLLAVMHQNSAAYGHMPATPDGEAVELARMAGCSAEEASRLVAELESRNVLSRSDDGRIFSRRMVRDRALSAARASAGRSGGFATAKSQQTPQQTPQQSVAYGIWHMGSASEGGSGGGSKRRKPAETAAQVASRPEYLDFLSRGGARRAWDAWLEWTVTAGAKARKPADRQAAAILNRGVKEGPERFAEAVEYAIAGNYLQPCYRDRPTPSRNGTTQPQMTHAQRARAEFERMGGSFTDETL